MPIIYDLTPDGKLAIFRHVGVVPDDEFLSSYKKYFQNPDISKAENLLVDLQKTRSSQRGSEALKKLSEFLRAKFKNSPIRRRVAVVAPTNVSFGLARMYEAFSELVPWEFVVFRDPDAAKAWLDVPESSRTAGKSDDRASS